MEVEIDAVAYTVQQARDTERNEHVSDGNENRTQGDAEDDILVIQTSSNNSTLQHALAADRLRSLKKTKAQLEKELLGLQKEKPSKTVEYDKVIQNLVKEEARPKKRLKETPKFGKDLEKQKKTISFDDDFDFDAVLDAASAGFVETVSGINFQIHCI